MVATIDPLRVPTTGNDVLSQTGAFVVLSGYDGHDKLTAGSGNDVFQEGVHLWIKSVGGFIAGQSYDLGLGNDTFYGGAGYDLLTIDGTARASVLDLSALTLVRGSEIDRFVGVEAFELGAGADIVTGLMTGSLVATGSGNDSVTGLSSGGFLDGGTGTDLLDLRLRTTAVDIDETFAGTVAGSEVHGFERIFGALQAANRIYATAVADFVAGGQFGDSLLGQGGRDTLLGYGGDDTLSGGLGNDSVNGAEGNDSLSGGNDQDLLLGYSGDDILLGEAGNDSLLGAEGNDWLFGGDGNDTLYGAAGNDTLQGDFGRNLLWGGEGDNLFILTEGFDTVLGGSGNDTVRGGVDVFTELGTSEVRTGLGDDLVNLTSGRSSVYAGDGRDTVTIGAGLADGGSGDDTLAVYGNGTLYGQDGADLMIGGSAGGASALFGGAGNDTLRCLQDSSGTLVAQGGAGDDLFIMDYNQSFHAITANGGTGIDRFELQNAFAVTLSGGGEATTVIGHEIRSLTYFGGNGVDDIRFSDGGTTFGTVNLGGGDDMLTLLFTADGETFNESVVFGGAGNDVVQSWGAALYGGTGNDTLTTYSPLTKVDGGSGDDLIVLDDPNGLLNTSDMGTVYGGKGYDTARIGVGFYALYQADADTATNLIGGRALLGVEAFEFFGSQTHFADVIGFDYDFGDDSDGVAAHVAGHHYDLGAGNDWGEAWADDTTILGGAGNDYLAVRIGHGAVLDGGDGNDYFEVLGDATVLGGAGADTVQLEGPAGGWLGLQASISTGDDNDQVTVTEMIGTVDLGSGDDHIVTGGSGGSAPLQIAIATGSGRDIITTYGGLSGVVTISDFDPVQDVINIQGVDRLRDFDVFRNGPAGVTLVEGSMTLVLLGLTLAELPELVFVP